MLSIIELGVARSDCKTFNQLNCDWPKLPFYRTQKPDFVKNSKLFWVNNPDANRSVQIWLQNFIYKFWCLFRMFQFQLYITRTCNKACSPLQLPFFSLSFSLIRYNNFFKWQVDSCDASFILYAVEFTGNIGVNKLMNNLYSYLTELSNYEGFSSHRHKFSVIWL